MGGLETYQHIQWAPKVYPAPKVLGPGAGARKGQRATSLVPGVSYGLT